MVNKEAASATRLVAKSKIYIFARVWMQMYRNHANIPFDYFEDPMFVGNGLEELGFSMDCGKALEENYPEANLGLRRDKWKKILKNIDLFTLGNAIFSQWRYFNHWHEAPMTEDDFQWFALSFSRLAQLTQE